MGRSAQTVVLHN